MVSPRKKKIINGSLYLARSRFIRPPVPYGKSGGRRRLSPVIPENEISTRPEVEERCFLGLNNAFPP